MTTQTIQLKKITSVSLIALALCEGPTQARFSLFEEMERDRGNILIQPTLKKPTVIGDEVGEEPLGQGTKGFLNRAKVLKKRLKAQEVVEEPLGEGAKGFSNRAKELKKQLEAQTETLEGILHRIYTRASNGLDMLFSGELGSESGKKEIKKLGSNLLNDLKDLTKLLLKEVVK